MVPLYLSISLPHNKTSRMKSIGVIFTSSAPKNMGTVRKPTMPISWNSGSQLTMTSISGLYLEATYMPCALAYRLRWVILTALGDPVEPDVSCMRATESSSASRGSIGSASHRSLMCTTMTPFSSRTGAAASNGADTMTALAPIMSTTLRVSSAHTARSVRGVGWCSIVSEAPRIHTAWIAGAISTGMPTNMPMASSGPSPAPASPPATCLARSWTCFQVCRTGVSGSPVTMPLLLDSALAYSSSVNLLTVPPGLGLLGESRFLIGWSAT